MPGKRNGETTVFGAVEDSRVPVSVVTTIQEGEETMKNKASIRILCLLMTLVMLMGVTPAFAAPSGRERSIGHYSFSVRRYSLQAIMNGPAPLASSGPTFSLR